MLKFVTDLNFKSYIGAIENVKNRKFYHVKGMTPSDHIKDYISYIPDNAKYVIDVGFHQGIFSLYVLDTYPNVKVISLDYGDSEETWYCKTFIDNKFPGRHMLLTGDIESNIKILSNLLYDKVDYIYINPYTIRTINVIYNYVFLLMSVSDKHTIIFMTYIAPNLSWGYK